MSTVFGNCSDTRRLLDMGPVLLYKTGSGKYGEGRDEAGDNF